MMFTKEQIEHFAYAVCGVVNMGSKDAADIARAVIAELDKMGLLAERSAQPVADDDLSYGRKLIAEAIEAHFGERPDDEDELDDTTLRDVWEAFDASPPVERSAQPVAYLNASTLRHHIESGSAQTTAVLHRDKGVLYGEDDVAVYASPPAQPQPELEQLVRSFVLAEIDYMTRNRLGDPEQQHNVKWARKLGITDTLDPALAGQYDGPTRPAQPQPDYPEPTKEMLNGDPLFDAIWAAIKGWDISRHNDGVYAGPTGNDARYIYDAIKAAQPQPELSDPDLGDTTRTGEAAPTNLPAQPQPDNAALVAALHKIRKQDRVTINRGTESQYYEDGPCGKIARAALSHPATAQATVPFIKAEEWLADAKQKLDRAATAQEKK